MIIVFSLLKQNQFKSQGIKLIPDSADDQAAMYQHMMEGLALTDKLSKLHLHKSERWVTEGTEAMKTVTH